jgi:hypothetical protein
MPPFVRFYFLIYSAGEILIAQKGRGKYNSDKTFVVLKHRYNLIFYSHKKGARGSVVDSGTMPQAGRSTVRVPDEVDFFNLPSPFSRTIAQESTHPRTEMSTRKTSWG